ncbi:diguanylate cyclase domain-containing protein [Paractinoplanes durhamensis]|uniref:GGDEF domain-containing protein n=1 Tax=Paractinoplanes durhamensis TaxID=113563 RepID=A0ABQ3Z470_9ACTN|nr:diguanylate cyclase [Actinoplanes durhamensis]GIE04349.1 hypothetical protein Adu01nite_56990 [Actinoplanes durhamensis]
MDAVLAIEVTGDGDDDLVRSAFAELLRAREPGLPDLPVRLGGGEVTIVLRDLVSASSAYDVAGAIAAEAGPLVVSGRLTGMTASIGVAVSDTLPAEELTRRATVAMHEARRYAPQTSWAIWRESFDLHLADAA